MLELRPNCELCDKDLPPDSRHAMICSYECTYCDECVAERLHNVCPTCGGGFSLRPIRPKRAFREDLNLGLSYHPANTKRIHSRYSADEIAAHTARIKDIPPEER